MAEMPGITITYQGKECLPLFDLSRDVGLEPNIGFVTMNREDFKDFVVKESLPGVDMVDPSTVVELEGTGSGGSTVSKTAAAAKPPNPTTQEKPGPGARGMQSAGQLVFQEHIPGEKPSETHRVEFEQILVTERGVEVVYADDTDTNEACRVEITDIRYLYKSRGIVSGWINVPLGGTPEAGGSGTQGKASGLTLVKGSMRNGEKPWTVESVLVEKIFPNLPGSPQLRRQSPRPAFFDFEVGPKWWNPVVLAKEALRQVLEEFQLVFALNLDATVSIWARDTGELQLASSVKGGKLSAGQKFTTTDTSNASVDPRIATSRRLVAYKHVPPVAVVVGAPVIQGIRMRLEACGMKDGKVVPLAEAISGIGLDMGRAAKFAILTREERAAKLGVTEDGLKEFERWAFKWYRLPGGVEQNADKLPILDARAAIGVTGELLPLRVFSENHTVVRVPYLDKRRGPAGAAARIPAKKEQLKETEDALRNPGLTDEERKQLREKRDGLQDEIQKLEKIALGTAQGPLNDQVKAKAEVDKAKAAAKQARNEFEAAVASKGATSEEALAKMAIYTNFLHEANKAEADFGAAQAKDSTAFKATQQAEVAAKAARDAFEAAVKSSGPTSDDAKSKLAVLTAADKSLVDAKKAEGQSSGGARARSVADKIAEDLSKAKVEHLRVMVPVSYGEQNSGFSVDLNNGIVMFEDVQGRVVQTDQDFAATLEDGLLSEFAAVELEFAFQRKPGPADDVTLSHCYSSVWLRKDDGAKAAIKQIASNPPGAAPLLIGPKPELQEIRSADGKTNRPFLDLLARRIAEGQLRVEQSTEGAVVEFCRPVPLVNTGSVLSINWACSQEGVPRVTAHIGSFSRLSPPPDPLATRAYGGLRDPNGGASGAVFLPKGLQ